MSLVLSVDNHIMKNTSLVRKCVELYKSECMIMTCEQIIRMFLISSDC